MNASTKKVHIRNNNEIINSLFLVIISLCILFLCSDSLIEVITLDSVNSNLQTSFAVMSLVLLIAFSATTFDGFKGYVICKDKDYFSYSSFFIRHRVRLSTIVAIQSDSVKATDNETRHHIKIVTKKNNKTKTRSIDIGAKGTRDEILKALSDAVNLS